MFVLSCFKPFGNRSQNNSCKLLSRIKELADKDLLTDITFLKPLAVVYDQAFEELKQQIEQLATQPKLLLAFGEATTEKLRLELIAENLDNSKKADEANNLRTNKKIDATAPDFLGATALLEKAFHMLDTNVQNQFTLSNNCGNFVCNNLSFHSLKYFNTFFDFGFIHVSNSKMDLTQDAQVTIKLIKALKTLY